MVVCNRITFTQPKRTNQRGFKWTKVHTKILLVLISRQLGVSNSSQHFKSNRTKKKAVNAQCKLQFLISKSKLLVSPVYFTLINHKQQTRTHNCISGSRHAKFPGSSVESRFWSHAHCTSDSHKNVNNITSRNLNIFKIKSQEGQI